MQLKAVYTALALALVGCDGCGAREEAAPPTTPAAAPSRGATGVIEGTVRLAPGTELPEYPVNPLVTQGRPDLPSQCTPPQEADRRPVRLGDDDGLAGLLVALSEFSGEPTREPVTHDLFIRDCRLTPSLVVATRGDRLRLVNETDYPYMPEFGTGMLQAVLHNREREVELAQGGVRTLQCAFAASCGRAEIVTLYHPLYAVTDEAGHFRIEGVPAGDGIQVNAWHPLFLEVRETITLAAGERRRVDLVITPAPPQEAPPERPPGRAEDNPDILF